VQSNLKINERNELLFKPDPKYSNMLKSMILDEKIFQKFKLQSHKICAKMH